jgi:hypothetical protein
MRMIVINQATDLASVATRLLGGTAGREAGLQQLQRLNPHVDVQSIAPGTVLLVPEGAGFEAGQSSSVSGQAFEGLRTQVLAATAAAAPQVRQGFDALASDRADVTNALKTAAVRRVVDGDPDLKPQLDAAAQQFKQDQQRAKDAALALKLLQDGALAELDTLAKRLS